MNKDYEQFTTDNFIADELFQQWVKNPNEELSLFWQQWLKVHPYKQADVNKAIIFLNSMRFQTAFPNEQEIEYALQKQLQLIEAIVDVSDHQQKKNDTPRLFLWSAAALFTALLFFAGWYFWQPGIVTIETVTGIGEIKTFALPDNSFVTLNGKSSLSYTSSLKTSPTREVWLNGEAFFEVKNSGTKEPRRFIVHSGDLDVEVFGTSFNVKKLDSVTDVTLNFGKIKIVLKNDQGSVLYLQPGDFIRYSIKDKHILKKQVRTEMYCGWKEDQLKLDKVPLADILQFIRDIYGYDTRINNSELTAAKISGTLLLKNEKEFMETLAYALNIDIIKKDSLLIFESKSKN